MDGRPDCLVHLPEDVQWTTPDGVFVKGMIMARRGTIVSQHAHEYAHTSLVAKGSVRVWVDGDEHKFKDYHAPDAIVVPALAMHKFQSLVDNTAVYCIHNVARTGHVEIHKYAKGVT